MKRLYVRPLARAEGLGRQLAERIGGEARAAGYRHIFLDTLPSMSAAIQLHSSLNFQRIEPYGFNPIPGAIFLGRDLRS